MKNFQEIIEADAQRSNPNRPIKKKPQKLNLLEKSKAGILKGIGPIALSLITAPFTTVSILLQVTQKPLISSISNKLSLQPKGSVMLKHIKRGIFGDSHTFRVFKFGSYRQVLEQLGKQGLRGMYKGNLTGLFHGMLSLKVRGWSCGVVQTHSGSFAHWLQSPISIAILACTLTDLMLLPLMLCQSRLVLQNSLPNFRTYNSPVSILSTVPKRLWLAGGSLLILKNTFVALSWVNIFKEHLVLSFLTSNILAHITTYPLLTLIRNLQCSQQGIPMMHDREARLRSLSESLWKSQGIQGFYRGFLGYALVHSFTALIMLQVNVGFLME